jgi:hypothetical protein
VHAEPVVRLEGSLVSEWIAPHDTITLSVERDAADSGRVAVFVGTRDVTSLFRPGGNDTLVYSGELQPLPAGEQELIVYLVHDSDGWRELSRHAIRVRTSGGYEAAEWQPRLELTERSLLDEGSSDQSQQSVNAADNALSMQAGLATRHRRSHVELRTAWNLVGSTVQEEALRFGIDGDAAPAVDLSDYLVEFENGASTFAAGHVAFGNQPLLLSGLANRGIAYRYAGGRRMDFAITAQNAQRIVGYNNLAGLNDSDNQIAAATVGVELFAKRPGAARLEATYLDATVKSLLNFNTGEVPDAEESTGTALQFVTSTPGGRLRATLNYARSTYTNPDDPFLSQGQELVAVRETESTAQNAEIGLVILQNKALPSGSLMSLMMRLRHDRADALYRSVGASVAPGQLQNSVSLDGSAGQGAFQIQLSRGEDNLDNLPTVLKTRTDIGTLNYVLPLQSLFRSTAAFLPQFLTHSYQRTHQTGLNLPPTFDPLTHIPDQVTENHNLSLSWTVGGSDISYQFAYGDQDNRQPGRANADFKNASHGINVGLRPIDRLGLTIGVAMVDSTDVEQSLEQQNLSYTFGFDWQIADSLFLRGTYGHATTDDSAGFSESQNYTAQSELLWRFELPVAEFKRLPGQLFLRHAIQGNQVEDRQFGFSADTRGWSINAGFSISLF